MTSIPSISCLFGDSEETGTTRGYLLFTALVLLALVVASLPVVSADDRWLRVGTIAVGMGLALWLPLRFLLPSVATLAVLPTLLRNVLQEESSEPLVLVAEIGGLILIASGVRFLYIAERLHARRLQNLSELVSSPAQFLEFRDSIASPHDTMSSSRGHYCSGRPVNPQLVPSYLGNRRLGLDDASNFLSRIRALDIELLKTGDDLRRA